MVTGMFVDRFRGFLKCVRFAVVDNRGYFEVLCFQRLSDHCNWSGVICHCGWRFNVRLKNIPVV